MIKLLCVLLLLTATGAYALEDGVTIPLVADRVADEGEEGILLGARVIVTNGTGHVFVDTNPYTQVDLQGSARLAAMVASDVLGIDQRSYDFYYIIDVTSPIIGGPSAGAALTVATVAAVKNWTLKPDVVMTGMINPDESIGPVGGIPFKLEAAAAKNATVFLIPEGQSTVTVRKTVTRARGAFIVSEEKEETVDVIELGKELNVEVKEVGTIQEAVRAFTGQEIIKPAYRGTVITPRYLSLLEPLATNLKKESATMYEQISSSAESQSVQQAKSLLESADKLYDEKKYYAATSLYFISMYNMRFIQWKDGYEKASDKEQYLTDLVDKVEKQIKLSETSLDSFKLYGISDVEAVGAAESRITIARAKLEEAKKLNDTDEKISSLAFAHERARTAQWWLTLATPDEKVIPDDVLKDRAGWYLSQAQSINTYMQTLLSESALVHPDIVGGASEDISNAQKELARGYYAGAIFDSLQATIKASTSIGLLGSADAGKKVEQSSEAAKAAINEARIAGIEPTLAVSAYEYADTLTNSYDRISQYSYAKMIAKTSLVLNSHAVPANKTAVRPTITPFMAAEMPSPAPTAAAKAMPAFEAIALVAVLLTLRSLKKK